MAQSILEVKHLTHTYGEGSRGIRNLSFALKQGEFVLVAGPNGSGKSTLFRHLNGLMQPKEGAVLHHGLSIWTNRKTLSQARQRVGMIFQDADCQIVGETVASDIAFGPENLNIEYGEIRRRVDDVMKTMNLSHLRDENPAALSGGEKRRLAIAGVLVMSPEVIVMDEPFSNLDYPGTLDLLSCIVSLHQTGHTLILSTHDIEKVIAHVTRMIILHHGKIVADDRPERLVDKVEQYGIRQPCVSKYRLVGDKEMVSWLN